MTERHNDGWFDPQRPDRRSGNTVDFDEREGGLASGNGRVEALEIDVGTAKTALVNQVV